MNKEIYLIRHAESEANAAMDLGQPITEPDLESQGSATEAPEGGEI